MLLIEKMAPPSFSIAPSNFLGKLQFFFEKNYPVFLNKISLTFPQYLVINLLDPDEPVASENAS